MKSFRRFIITIILLVLGVFIFNSVTVSTYPNEYKLIKQFGAIVRIEENPGWSFKVPFIQSTQSIPKYKMCYDLAPTTVNTSDKKMMIADCFALWEVSDPKTYVVALNANIATAESRIDNVVYENLKSVISATKQDDVISGRDGELAQTITDNIGNSLEAYGIRLLKVETKMLDLPDENKESVFQRMISERNNISASYTAQGDSEYNKIKNETDKEVNIKRSEAEAQAEQIKAEGEAQYMQILSNAYNDESKADFYNFVRSLDALKATVKGDNKTIILDKDSELAKLLIGIN